MKVYFVLLHRIDAGRKMTDLYLFYQFNMWICTGPTSKRSHI